MLKKASLLIALALSFGDLTSAQRPAPARGGAGVALGDWPEARGPSRDGTSKETGLLDKWALNGENFLWRAPYGGRSAPVVLGNRVYVQNPSGRGATLQERVMALDADTGKVVWEYKFNIFQSDVPPHRVGWASPAVDTETGNIYALGVGATVLALSKDGKLIWERSVGEEFAAFTTHGGRTMSPLIDGDLVIVSAPISSWGAQASRAHRFIGLDKRTGDIIWVATPGGRPYDTAYAAPVIATINGMRLLICGTGDGAVHAIKPQTGEKVWSFVASKRAINTGVVVKDGTVFMSHGDENIDTSELGHRREPIASPDRTRQAHGRDDLRGQSRRPSVRHQLLVADDRDDQWHAAADFRQRRRRRARHQTADRREGVELHRRETRD